MNQSAIPLPDDRRGFWVRLLHTPAADLVRLRVTGRLDVKALMAEADLPEPLRQVVRQVAKKTRLWRCEKVDVAQELIDHFGDGLAAGQSPDGLIEAFGNPRQAARLIRRAKRRNRPLFWRVWGSVIRVAAWTLAAAIVLYAVIFVRFLWGKPTIAWNYMAELNAEAKAIPEDERAWPLYREALMKLEPVPGDFPTEHRQPNVWELAAASPDEVEMWNVLSAYVARNQQSIELTRRAAAKRRLGYCYGNPADAVPFPADPACRQLVPSPRTDNPMVIHLLLEHVQRLRLLALFLRADAGLAAEDGDGARATADLVAQLGICRHSYDAGRFLISNLVGLALLTMAFDTVGEILADRPETFSDEDLHELAHEIAATGDGGPLRLQWEGERAKVRDLLQRIYTDNGEGDGRLTPEGMQALLTLAASVFQDLGIARGHESWGKRLYVDLLGSAASVAVPERRELSRLADRLLDQMERESQTPLWQRSKSKVEEEVHPLWTSPIEAIRFAPVLLLLPCSGSPIEEAERTTQRRDAALVAIALELYRRRAGDWPERLDQLVPDLLPSVPPDRFDGRPLRYRLADGRPVVYSVGCDRVDDGGMPPRSARAYESIRFWYPTWPTDSLPRDQEDRGDWVLWPPVEGGSD